MIIFKKPLLLQGEEYFLRIKNILKPFRSMALERNFITDK